MARSTDEIQADISLTRHLIESRLDALERNVRRPWWMPYALVAGGLVLGLTIARVPLLKIIATGSQMLTTGLSVAGAVAAAERLVAERRRIAA